MDTEETYEVIAVRYGTRQTTRSAVYLNYSLYGEADAAIGMDYYFWIVRNARRTIVVDTGYGAVGAQHRNRTFLLDPAQALRELGVDPATATVVLTHAHYDHVGNLALFPQAPLVLPRTEYAFWTGPLRERFLFHHTIEDGDIADLRRAHADERVQLVDEATTVAPGWSCSCSAATPPVRRSSPYAPPTAWSCWPRTRPTTTRSWTVTCRSSWWTTCPPCTPGSTASSSGGVTSTR